MHAQYSALGRQRGVERLRKQLGEVNQGDVNLASMLSLRSLPTIITILTTRGEFVVLLDQTRHMTTGAVSVFTE